MPPGIYERTPEIRDQIASKIKALWKNKKYKTHMIDAHKGQVAWNTGLTKDTDERVRKLSEDEDRKEKIGKFSKTVKLQQRNEDPHAFYEHMRKMRSKQANNNSKIEQDLRSYLNYKYVEHLTNVFKIEGIPDVLIINNKSGNLLLKPIIIFADGCYWHGCRKCYNIFEMNYNYFEKIIEVRHYDKLTTLSLKNRGFEVFRIWEHDFKNKKYKNIINKIIKDNKL